MLGVGAYGAYRIWQKKRELDELLQAVGLDQLLGGSNGDHAKSSREARCAYSTSAYRSSDITDTLVVCCRVREHFSRTQQEADRLLREALPRLQEQVNSLLDVEEFKKRMVAEDAMKDMSRWHEMRCLVVSRLLTAQ